VALPVLNEAGTLVNLLNFATKYKTMGLLDEIMVIDSGSIDGSDILCKNYEVNYLKAENLAKEAGVNYVAGKGWNLWISVKYLKTDIILWLDSDIRNLNEGFILGLLGPLLVNKDVNFIKGYYHRPEGGGRVTEILVRPLINLLFPKVQAFIQPLSGEYGGRRKYLEKIDYYSGYSVDIAILIQISEILKNYQIGQVFLGTRLHKNQSVDSLGKMSIEITRTLFKLAEERSLLSINVPLGKILRNFSYTNNVLCENFYEATDVKLPPITKLN